MEKTDLAKSTNAFGIEVLRKLWKEAEENKTVFISPASISLALSMVLNGASGETRKAMAKTLGVPADKLDEVNAAVKELIAELSTADDKAKLEVANAIFGKLGYEFKPEFLATNIANFGAEIKPLDFEGDPEGALKAINGWCDQKTHGKIPSILDKIPPGAAMFLLNAVYFKGMWQTKFDEQQTKPRTFTLLDGTTKDHPTMKQVDEYPYLETDDFQAASLPYGEEGRFSMYFFLPKRGKSVANLVNGLTGEAWERYMHQFDSAPGTVYLPKFKLEYETELNDALKALGMEVAFDEQNADFSNLVPLPDRVLINQVKHKTFIEVNEEFTEAAAVTSVGMVFATSIRMPKPPFVLDLNRPFLTGIRDNWTGAVLFLGAIVEPK